jgi:predicted nucleotide-binding protein
MAKLRSRSTRRTAATESKANPKPTLFVASNSEMLEMATAAQRQLQDVADVQVWTQSTFNLGETALDSMTKAARSFDFALIFLEGEDRAISRGVQAMSPRDNVVFELGFYMGLLGRERTFVIFNANRPPELPSYLHGLLVIPYYPSNDKRAALGPACNVIRDKILKLGHRPKQALRAFGASGA